MNKQPDELFVREVIDLLQRLASGDFSARKEISSKNDLIDAVITGLNMLGEELQSAESAREKQAAALEESQAHFKELYDHMSSGVTVYQARDDGRDFTIVDLNRAAERIDRIKKKNTVGKSLTELFPAVGESGHLAVMQKVWRTGKPQYVPPTFYRDDRIQGWRENHVYKLPTGEVVSVFDDVSERKRMLDELRDKEEMFRSISESAQDGIIMVDNEARICYWNTAASKIFGYSIKEATGKNLHRLLAPNKYLGAIKTGFHHFKQTGLGAAIGKTLEVEGRRKNGKVFPLALSLSAVQIEGKWNSIGIVRDITAQKKIEKELRASKKAAEVANQAKSEFLANMSHEIRTPMNAILGFTEILESQTKDKITREHLSAISASSKSMLRLINDILDLSKIEAGKLELRYKATDIKALLHEIEKVFSWKAKEKHIDFKVEMDPELPNALYLDEVRIRQILFNLVGNALKFTNKGFVKLSLNQEYTKRQRSNLDLYFTVQDTGIGIPSQQQKRIFDAFIQQQGQNDRIYGGTGLGLTITKRLVEQMGGNLTVESRKGKGSKFKIHLKNIDVASLKELPEKMGEEDFRNVMFAHARILLVDDVLTNRMLASAVLKSYDFEIIEAVNGKEAFDLARKHKPDLILMDMRMPVMDGFLATRLIKREKGLESVPVIAFTALAMKGGESEIWEAGCDGNLIKPISRVHMITELMRFLPHSRVGDEVPESEKRSETETAAPREELDPKIVAKLPELVRMLRNEHKEQWEDIRQTFVISRILAFSQTMLKLGSAYELQILEEWGEKLQNQAQSFDMEDLPVTLDQYEELVNTIAGIVDL